MEDKVWCNKYHVRRGDSRLNSLFLSGFGISLSVDRARLLVRDGLLEPDVEPQRFEVQPRHASFDSVIVDGHSGSITLDAIKWLMRHDIPVFILDYDGTLLSSTMPREPVNGPLKIAQIDAYRDRAKRFYIAKKLVEAKAERSLDVMKWLAARYGGLTRIQADFSNELERIEQCVDLPRLRSIEGRIADIYWRYLQRVLPAKFGFASRMHETHQMNASDPVNVLLNYGYAILESQCRKALNSVGLEPTVGFLHEARQTRYPLVYDFQEPYRWLVDTTVISCLENGRFGKKDFYRMDNYVLRLRPESAKKLIDALRIKFNSPVRHAGKVCGWDTLIRLKAQELANYILSRRNELDFGEPRAHLHRTDSAAIRSTILSLTASEARNLGIRKNTLWYLQRRVRSDRSMNIYAKVKAKLPEI
jgi:CRISPR-associated protein Cas1